MNVIRGVLDPFFETGTEGVIWSVYEDGRTGYDGLNCLADGDYLRIFDKEDPTKVVWEGIIDLEWERNYRKYPLNPKYGQQEVGGFWVHGIQKPSASPDRAPLTRTGPVSGCPLNFQRRTSVLVESQVKWPSSPIRTRKATVSPDSISRTGGRLLSQA